MNKAIFIEGLVLISFGYYAIITHEHVYSSLIGAYINTELTRYPLSIGLVFFGCLLIINAFKNK